MKIVNKEVLKDFRGPGPCEWCRRPFQVLQAAHLFAKGMGSGKRLDVRWNLAGLCAFCHSVSHAGQRPLLCDLLAIVAKREDCLQEEIRDAVYLIRRTPKGTPYVASWSPREFLENLT